MSFFARRLLLTVAQRQPHYINNLTTTFRNLTLKQAPLLQKYELDELKTSALTNIEEQKECQQIFNNVNQQLAAGKEGRLFAVVQLCGKQFKITNGDIILVEGYWPPTIGDEIRLEKVLLAGGRDFTLIGMPMLEPGLVDIQATIIEKTLQHTKTHFRKKRRKQYLRINFQRSPNTMIRINSIEVKRKVDEPSTIADNDKRIF